MDTGASGKFIDMDVAVSKNLVVTIGNDRYLRLWEYSIGTALASTPLNAPFDA